jgi:hypothetical protein
MRFWSFTQSLTDLRQKILRQTTRQVTKKSGAARMKSILSVTASVAMSWMIGSRLKQNSEETGSLVNHKEKSGEHEIARSENGSLKR